MRYKNNLNNWALVSSRYFRIYGCARSEYITTAALLNEVAEILFELYYWRLYRLISTQNQELTLNSTIIGAFRRFVFQTLRYWDGNSQTWKKRFQPTYKPIREKINLYNSSTFTLINHCKLTIIRHNDVSTIWK